MPTQELPRARAEELLGAGAAFLPGPGDNPISAGLPAGTVTDDTEQALVLARLLVTGGGRVDPHDLARDLLAWEATMAARGSLDLLGPSTKAALEAVRGGADPRTTGRRGTTNGAAMRVTPVGIACPPRPLGRLLAAVDDAGRVTHDTAVARAAAGAVAAAVSTGIQGEGHRASLAAAAGAARDRDAHLADRLDAALALARLWVDRIAREREPVTHALDEISDQVGTSLACDESVPAAFAVAILAQGDPWQAIWCAARLGGDADTIAAIAGAVCGASAGSGALPAEALTLVRSVNGLRLEALVDELLALRNGPPAAPAPR